MNLDLILLRGRLFYLCWKVGRVSTKPTVQALQSCIESIKLLRDEVSRLPPQDGGPLLDRILDLTLALVGPIGEVSQKSG